MAATKKGFVSSQNYFADHPDGSEGILSNNALLLTVHFVFGQRDRVFRRRVIDAALTLNCPPIAYERIDYSN